MNKSKFTNNKSNNKSISETLKETIKAIDKPQISDIKIILTETKSNIKLKLEESCMWHFPLEISYDTDVVDNLKVSSIS